MHRRLDANLLPGVVILADNSLRAMGEAFHRKMEENPLLHLVDEVIYDPLGVTEIVEHIVQIQCRDMPVMPRIKPNQYAGGTMSIKRNILAAAINLVLLTMQVARPMH